MLFGTQEEGFAALAFLSLPFNGVRVAFLVEEGVIPLHNRMSKDFH